MRELMAFYCFIFHLSSWGLLNYWYILVSNDNSSRFCRSKSINRPTDTQLICMMNFIKKNESSSKELEYQQRKSAKNGQFSSSIWLCILTTTRKNDFQANSNGIQETRANILSFHFDIPCLSPCLIAIASNIFCVSARILIKMCERKHIFKIMGCILHYIYV